jgi:hypothetical protein
VRGTRLAVASLTRALLNPEQLYTILFGALLPSTSQPALSDRFHRRPNPLNGGLVHSREGLPFAHRLGSMYALRCQQILRQLETYGFDLGLGGGTQSVSLILFVLAEA